MDRIETNDQAMDEAAPTTAGEGGRLGLLSTTSTTSPSLTLADYLPDPVGRQLRVSLVTPHLTHAEGKWMGYPAQPTYTVVTVTTASALMSAITAAAGQSRIIECNWDGLSETATGSTGRTSSSLTANAAVDWGYNRSATNILVRPRAGRTPRVRGTVGRTATGVLDGAVGLTGLSRIEFRDMVFDGCGVRLTRNSTYPEIAMAVFRRCTFLNHKDTDTGTVYAQGVRLLHVEDCLFDGCAMGILHSAHFMRSWNNGFVRHFNQDMHASRSYIAPYQQGWCANIWISGAVVWGMNPQPSAHIDLSQISTSQVEVHKGYKQLMEFCVYYADNGTQYSTQGLFGDDGAAQGYRCDHLVHNNVLVTGANWAVVAYDPSDDGTKVVSRNIVARVGFGFGYGGASQYDAYPRIVGNKEGQPFGTGRMIVSENYFAIEPDDCGRAKDDDNRWGNIDLDSRSNAATATRPETLLTGNGTWGKNAAGRTTYADPAPASMTKAAAKAALLGFFQPKVGWRGMGAGPVDPACWPADPSTVSADISALAVLPPDRVLTSQWSVVDAAMGGVATVTVSSLDAEVTGLAVVVDGRDPVPLAEPLLGEHTITDITNFSHAFSLVASNANGVSGASATKACNVTAGAGIFHFDEIVPARAGSASCTAIEGGWQWTTSGTGARALYWSVNDLMTAGKAYLFELSIEADSLINAISARCAYNTALTTVRGLNTTVTPSATGVKQTFTHTSSAGNTTHSATCQA